MFCTLILTASASARPLWRRPTRRGPHSAMRAEERRVQRVPTCRDTRGRFTKGHDSSNCSNPYIATS